MNVHMSTELPICQEHPYLKSAMSLLFLRNSFLQFSTKLDIVGFTAYKVVLAFYKIGGKQFCGSTYNNTFRKWVIHSTL